MTLSGTLLGCGEELCDVLGTDTLGEPASSVMGLILRGVVTPLDFGVPEVLTSFSCPFKGVLSLTC